MASAPPGALAPAVSYTALDGAHGGTDRLRGKVVLVNFWATSCTTCVMEMAQIVATHEKKFKARGYEALAVAMSYDRPAYVADFAQTRRLPFSVTIDYTGEIVKRYVGAPDFDALQALVARRLAEACAGRRSLSPAGRALAELGPFAWRATAPSLSPRTARPARSPAPAARRASGWSRC
jgi:peroxiredoxin